MEGSNYAGVDWVSEKHDVLIADETGEELLAATFAHDEAGLRSLCRTLVRHKVTLVAIERPDGLLVERLLDAGLRVLALHPNQVAATAPASESRAASPTHSTRSCCASWRGPTTTASGCSSPTATTPRCSGRCAADARISCRPGGARQPAARRARAVLAGRGEDLRRLDSPIGLAFLERYPSPADASTLGQQRLAAFLRREGYSGRQDPAKLRASSEAPPRARRRAGDRHAPAAGARARRDAQAAGGADQDARAADRRRGSRAPDGPISSRCAATPRASSPLPRC